MLVELERRHHATVTHDLVDRALEPLAAGLGELGDAGVVHQDVDGTVPADDLGEERPDLIRPRDVGGDGLHSAAELLGGGVTGRGIDVGDDHPGTLPGEARRHCPTDARRPTGHDRDLVFETHDVLRSPTSHAAGAATRRRPDHGT